MLKGDFANLFYDTSFAYIIAQLPRVLISIFNAEADRKLHLGVAEINFYYIKAKTCSNYMLLTVYPSFDSRFQR